MIGAVGDFENVGSIELDYSGFGLYINPRAELPLFEIANSPASIFISPGIGLSLTTISVDFGQNLANDSDVFNFREIDATQISFSFQVKGGVKIPVTNSINIIGQ
ncbi:MAG: hypothetical protein HC930_17070 [Hydrococcus sp. SU_1_0]|nr:hypothetical protein [Hydrococcus sp. SU_1_0]